MVASVIRNCSSILAGPVAGRMALPPNDNTVRAGMDPLPFPASRAFRTLPGHDGRHKHASSYERRRRRPSLPIGGSETDPAPKRETTRVSNPG